MRKEFGTNLDARIGRGTEWITRKIDRRTVLRTTMLSGTATIGALALGQRPAFATIRCPNSCGPSPLCSGYCGLSTGCPSGYSICKHPPTSCGGLCEYASGSWIHCTGYGKCGLGYTLCQDCKPTNSCNICICVSGILCGQCCSAADVVAEHNRIQEGLARAS